VRHHRQGLGEGWVTPEIPRKPHRQKSRRRRLRPGRTACADQLNQAGHSVTVFERADRIGGLLMYGIPNMKLDKEEVVQRRVDLLADRGHRFQNRHRHRQGLRVDCGKTPQ
jgi:glutamate synthase (NADPH) small chain